MILGIGVDIVRVDRLAGWLFNGMAERFFHPSEVAACRGRGDRAVQSLAARFGAKEAFGKALGTGIRGFSLREVEVSGSGDGRPRLLLHGRAQAAAATAGVSVLHLTISHEREYAVAMVVLEE